MDESTVSRKLDALTSEIREVRRLVTQLVDAQRPASATQARTATPPGVRRFADGRVFLPGSGVLGSQPLSDEALAALAALDTAAEPDRRQFGADHHPQSTERPLESRLRDEQVVSRGVGAEATIQRLRTQHRGSGPQPDPGGPNRDTPTHDHSQW